MSYAQNTQVPQPDAFLMQQVAPPQEKSLAELLDPTYFSLDMLTPIGRVSYANLAAPRAAQPGQAEKFSLTLLLNPAAVGDLWKAITMVANCRWPAEQVPDPSTGQLVTLTGEHLLNTHLPELQRFKTLALHNPLRDGNETYMKNREKYAEYWGVAAVNASTAKDKPPLVFDAAGNEAPREIVYSGCYARLLIRVSAFPKPNKQSPARGVGIYVNCIQFARRGEKLGGYDAAAAGRQAFAAGGALPLENPPGFGFNSGAPPAVGGFASPPPAANGGAPQGYPQQPQQPQQPQGYPQPQPQPQPQQGAPVAPPGFVPQQPQQGYPQQPQQPQQPQPGQPQWGAPQSLGGPFPPR